MSNEFLELDSIGVDKKQGDDSGYFGSRKSSVRFETVLDSKRQQQTSSQRVSVDQTRTIEVSGSKQTISDELNYRKLGKPRAS